MPYNFIGPTLYRNYTGPANLLISEVKRQLFTSECYNYYIIFYMTDVEMEGMDKYDCKKYFVCYISKVVILKRMCVRDYLFSSIVLRRIWILQSCCLRTLLWS